VKLTHGDVVVEVVPERGAIEYRAPRVVPANETRTFWMRIELV